MLFFYEHFKKIIEDGKLFIGLAPKYRITLKNNEYKYFKNDYEYNLFIIEELIKKYSIKEMEIQEIVEMSEYYIFAYESYMYASGLSTDIANLILELYIQNKSFTKQLLKEALDNIDEYNTINIKKISGEYNLTGIFNGNFYSFIIDETFLDYLNNIIKIYNKAKFTVKDLITKKSTKMYIYDTIMMLKNSIKYTRVRMKGLGEQDAQSLRETTMEKGKRDVIKVRIDDVEQSNNITKVFFGPNPDLRKAFINENL